MKKLIGSTVVALSLSALALPAHAELFKWGQVRAKAASSNARPSFTLINLGPVARVAVGGDQLVNLGVLNGLRPVTPNPPASIQVLDLGQLATVGVDLNDGVRVTAFGQTVDANLLSAGVQP